MLTMAVPEVEILAVHFFTVCFNVFANVCGSRDGKFGDRVGIEDESCKIVFLVGNFYLFVLDTFTVGCIV